MKIEKIIVCCSHCHKEIKPEDKIKLDVINTITHESCDSIFVTTKDSGSFQEIQSKYSFLNITY